MTHPDRKTSRWSKVRVAGYALAWLVCLGIAGGRLYHARTAYDTPADAAPEWVRPDGNNGHAQIDFGGQWVTARMVASGHAAELYDRNRQWEIARAGYPTAREEPARRQCFPTRPGTLDPAGGPLRHDADNLMYWFMGEANDSPRWREVGAAVALPFAADAVRANPFAAAALLQAADSRVTPDLVAAVVAKSVGGPLYPPIHGFLYAPLGLYDDPADAYAAIQWAAVGAAFLAGFAASRLSRDRVWWPVATAAILLYPGCRSGIDLGQNPTFTLTIVLSGWALAARGRDAAGGAVWGLLAFKPVWAAAFLLVPLLMGRWRFCAAMAGTGIALAAATLPFTGIEPWFDWLAVGREASITYDVNRNWVELSRDLHGIPRRMLLDFTVPEANRHNRSASMLGWGLWAAVVVATAAVYRLRADRRYTTGLGAAFLFFGAYLACYRFMYYDALLSFAGVAVLFADPARLVRFATGEPTRLAFGPRWAGRLLAPPVLCLGLLYVCENEWSRYQTRATVEAKGLKGRPRVEAEIGYYHPWDTLLVLALWGWCGWRLLWDEDWGEPRSDAA